MQLVCVELNSDRRFHGSYDLKENDVRPEARSLILYLGILIINVGRF